MTRDQKILLLQPDVAEAIYNDFVAHKDGKEYGKLVKQLVSSTAQIEFATSNLLLTRHRIQHDN